VLVLDFQLSEEVKEQAKTKKYLVSISSRKIKLLYYHNHLAARLESQVLAQLAELYSSSFN